MKIQSSEIKRRRQAFSRRELSSRAISFAVAFLIVWTVLLAGLGGLPYENENEAIPAGAPTGITAENSSAKALRPKPVPDDWTLTIYSAGDIMMHSPQTKAGWQQDRKQYDFSFMFEKIAPILREGDLVIGNLETPLAGETNGGFTGYPMFNAPEILAQNLRDAGFTLVSTANNHSLDRRYSGLCTTLDHLDAAGLMHTGTYRTPEEQRNILYTQVKGVRIAVLAATYGANGLTLPKEHSYALDIIQEDRLLADLRRARQGGAQYVIVMLHWGAEYHPKPSPEQTTLAMNLLRGGADLILGNHPHVLQRGEIVRFTERGELIQGETGDDGDIISETDKALDKGQGKFVMYSQGNFISNQEGLDRLSSMLLKLTIGVDGATREPYLKAAEYIPTYTQKRDRLGAFRHTVWPLELALAQEQAGGASFGTREKADLPKAWEQVVKSQPNLDLYSLKNKPVWEELLRH